MQQRPCSFSSSPSENQLSPSIYTKGCPQKNVGSPHLYNLYLLSLNLWQVPWVQPQLPAVQAAGQPPAPYSQARLWLPDRLAVLGRISITTYIFFSISARSSLTLCQEWHWPQDPGNSLLQSLLEGNTLSFLSFTNLNHMSQDPPGTNYGTGLRAKTAQQMCDRWIPVLSSQVKFSKFSERRLPLSTTSLSTSQMIERAYDPPPLLPRTMTHSMSWILPDLWTLSKSFSICVLG